MIAMNKYFGGLNDAYTGAYQSGDKFIYASLISSIVTRTLLNPFVCNFIFLFDILGTS